MKDVPVWDACTGTAKMSGPSESDAGKAVSIIGPRREGTMQGMSVDPDQRRLLVRAPMMQTGGAVSPVVIRGRRLIPWRHAGDI